MAHGAAAAWARERAAQVSDAELVREVREGGGSAFELLVRRHGTGLRRMIRAVVRDRSEADDVVQQAFVQAFTSLSGWSGAAPFSIWLARIATNEARMRLRRSRRHQVATVQLAASGGGGGPDPEQQAACREEVARVTAALSRLPARHREVLQLAALSAVSDVSRAAVARRLGVSEGAVKVRLHRAREALRGVLREPRPPPLVLASGLGRRHGFGLQRNGPLLD